MSLSVIRYNKLHLGRRGKTKKERKKEKERKKKERKESKKERRKRKKKERQTDRKKEGKERKKKERQKERKKERKKESVHCTLRKESLNGGYFNFHQVNFRLYTVIRCARNVSCKYVSA